MRWSRQSPPRRNPIAILGLLVIPAIASLAACSDGSGKPSNWADDANTAANGVPTISGTPSLSATAGRLYEFQPSAADPDGDALDFSIVGKPGWATFDAKTGRLSGTPGSTDSGTTEDIMIVVSDGRAMATLPPFKIVVSSGQSGAVTVAWLPPTETVDGTPAINLAGYNVYYGQTPGALTNSLQVANPGATSVVVENLAPGIWYFAVTAYTTTNEESEKSNLGSTSI